MVTPEDITRNYLSWMMLDFSPPHISCFFSVSNKLVPIARCLLQHHLETGSVVVLQIQNSAFHESSGASLQLPDMELKEEKSLIPGWEKLRMFHYHLILEHVSLAS